jgi:hypothetical protein
VTGAAGTARTVHSALLVLACVLACSCAVLGPATAAADDEPRPAWSRKITARVGFAQNALSNWEAGGTSSVAWTWLLETELAHRGRRHDWQNDIALEYGLVKQQGEDLRKSVDRIELETVYTRRLDYYVEPYAAASARTQFALGRDYGVDVDPDDPDFEFPETSRFADPLYLSQSLGVGRQFNEELRSRFGFSVREIITENFRRYGCTDEEREAIEDVGTRDRACDPLRVDTGLESVTQYQRSFEERTSLRSRLKLFFSFEQPDQLDVHWRNEFTTELLDFVAFGFGLEMLYDKNVRDQLQIKQVMTIGLVLTLD